MSADLPDQGRCYVHHGDVVPGPGGMGGQRSAHRAGAYYGQPHIRITAFSTSSGCVIAYSMAFGVCGSG